MYFQYFSEWPAYSNPNATSCTVILDAVYHRNNGHRGEDQLYAGDTCI